jgi:hypothetical protein
MLRFFKGFILLSLLVVGMACGSDPGPFQMSTSTDMVIGDAQVTPVQFIVNPEEQTGEGTLTAQTVEEFSDRRVLSIQSFDLELNFPGIGPVTLVLNPNFESTATVFMLDSANQPAGTHTMTLFLIVETPDQNLTLDNVVLQSNTATLTLANPLPTLSFFLNGVQKQMQILSLTAVIPAQLITSNQDPTLTFPQE